MGYYFVVREGDALFPGSVIFSGPRTWYLRVYYFGKKSASFGDKSTIKYIDEKYT